MTADAASSEGTRARHLVGVGELVAARKFAEAEQALLGLLGGGQQDLPSLNLLALVRYKLGRLAEARETYREIASAMPEDATARRNLGLVALKLGRLDEALPELEMSVRLAPGDERAWSYLGYAYAKKGEVVNAAAAFRRAKRDALAIELEHAARPGRPPKPAASFGELGELRGPVALAPPLPPVYAPGTPDALPARRRVEPEPEPVEAVPVSLLAFVLSRLGQAPAPSPPNGPLRMAVADGIHVRADAVLAGSGPVEWQPAFRRVQGRRAGEAFATAAGPFFRLTGAGEVWVAGQRGRWLPVALTEDVLYVREDRVLAFDGQVSWEAGTVPGAGVRMLQFRGRGMVALEFETAPLAIKVTEASPTLLAAGRLVGWVGRLAPHGARLENGAPFQLACQGQGVVLLDAEGRER